MKSMRIFACACLAMSLGLAASGQQPAARSKLLEKSWPVADGLTVTVRSTKPQDLEVDLQIMGYFRHKASGDTVLSVIVDFDKMMGGPIKALRDRGEFMGEEQETILLTPPAGVMKPKKVLLVGYGDESKFSLDVIRRIGTTAVREAIRLGAKKAAFAPAIRDQGNSKFSTGDVERENVQGIILAYDTEKRLQKQGLAAPPALEQFYLEAGPEYFEQTVAGVEKGIAAAKAALEKRDKSPYTSK
jgi:hypothetical protein